MKTNNAKKRLLLALLLMFAAVAALVFFVFLPRNDEISKLETQINDQEDEYSTDKMMFDMISKNKEKLESGSIELNELIKSYYMDEVDAVYVKDVQNLFTNMKTSITPNNNPISYTDIVEYYSMYDLEGEAANVKNNASLPLIESRQVVVTFEGAKADFENFLKKVANNPTKYRIDSINTYKTEDVPGLGDTSTGSLSLSIFYIARINYADAQIIAKYANTAKPKMPSDIIDGSYRKINWLELITGLFKK